MRALSLSIKRLHPQMNPAAERMFKLNFFEVRGKLIKEVLPRLRFQIASYRIKRTVIATSDHQSSADY